MIIIRYEKAYRNDLIFMILQAKDALGRKPGLNEDLLDIETNYFEKGDNFYLAINEKDRVTGSIGYHLDSSLHEAYLHMLFVKASEKHKGIGTALYKTVEDELKARGTQTIKIHLGEPREQWFESYAFYKKHGYIEYDEGVMIKELN